MKPAGTPPTAYAEWSDCLERLAQGLDDEQVIALMAAGTLDWSAGVATLFSTRISEVFSIRLQRCADRLTRDLQHGMDETVLVRALLNARQTLSLLLRVASLSGFPERLRIHLRQELDRHAGQTQDSLERSAAQDRSGRLVSLIRHNSLRRFDAAPPIPTSPACPPVAAVAPGGSRKRLFLTPI